MRKMRRKVRATRRELDPLVAVLKFRRHEIGMRQEDLASAMGYNLSAIKEWETGNALPTFPSLKKWAGALGMTVEIRELNHG